MNHHRHERKRSRTTHEKQEVTDLWNSDYVPNSSVDSSLISKTDINELYEDVGENYEKLINSAEDGFIPFNNLPDEMKEDMYKRMNDLESHMKDRRLTSNVEECANMPLHVRDTHRHETIRIPQMNQKGNDMCMLDDRHKYHLNRLSKYSAFENFLLPKTFRPNLEYKTTIGKFIEQLYDEERIECVAIQLERELISLAMRLDERDIFYVCVQLRIPDANSTLCSIFSSHDNFIVWTTVDSTTEMAENEKKVIESTRVTFQRHCYFSCGCTNH